MKPFNSVTSILLLGLLIGTNANAAADPCDSSDFASLFHLASQVKGPFKENASTSLSSNDIVKWSFDRIPLQQRAGQKEGDDKVYEGDLMIGGVQKNLEPCWLRISVVKFERSGSTSIRFFLTDHLKKHPRTGQDLKPDQQDFNGNFVDSDGKDLHTKSTATLGSRFLTLKRERSTGSPLRDDTTNTTLQISYEEDLFGWAEIKDRDTGKSLRCNFQGGMTS